MMCQVYILFFDANKITVQHFEIALQMIQDLFACGVYQSAGGAFGKRATTVPEGAGASVDQREDRITPGIEEAPSLFAFSAAKAFGKLLMLSLLFWGKEKMNLPVRS